MKGTDGTWRVVPPGGRLGADPTGTAHVLPPGAKLVEGGGGRWLVKPPGAILVEEPGGRNLVTLPGLPEGTEVVVGANGRLVVRRAALAISSSKAPYPPPLAGRPPAEVIRGKPKVRPSEVGMREPAVVRMPAAPPIRAPRDIGFEFTENMRKVLFEFDKFRLTDKSRATLRENAAWLLEHPNIKVQIEGHCDERGTIDYNLGLGERRAISARSYLSSLGIEPARIFTISYGEERPVELGHDEGAWAQNRRVEFKIAQ
ncbi:MAG: peptidoglycan-associated lipoprotein Pal [Nitrospinae bacterium]|nr:peptidoglycan-associated lipoprotein Pal [Nitrospinota bacterium]